MPMFRTNLGGKKTRERVKGKSKFTCLAYVSPNFLCALSMKIVSHLSIILKGDLTRANKELFGKTRKTDQLETACKLAVHLHLITYIV